MTMVQSDQYGPSPASTAAAPGSAQPAAPQPQAIPFVRASRRGSQQDFAQTGLTLSTAQQQLGPFDIQTNGFLRYLELYVTQTASGNSATVAFTNDGPFNALQNVTLQDPSSEFIISPYTGYELAMAEKYFGYAGNAPHCDPRNDPNYLATTGSGGSGGSFTFSVKIPLEDRMRDAFCAVPNSAANKNYRLQAFMNTSAGIFSTGPTTAPANLQVQCTNFYWTEPPASIAGSPCVPTPNGNGSVGYLDREVFSSLTSLSNPALIFKNVGRVYKNVLFIARNTSSPSVRSFTDWPDPMVIWINGFPMYYMPLHTWKSETQKMTGYGNSGATIDTAGGLDTGVLPLYPLMTQTGHVDNWGPADQFLATVPSTKLQAVGVFGSTSSTLTLLERTIKPSSGAALYS